MGSLDASTIVGYLKANWDEVLLLGFTVVQCMTAIISLFRKQLDFFFMFAPVYFPTLILLIASMFYGQSWIALTGYVVGASITMLVTLWSSSIEHKSIGKMITNGAFTAILCLSLIFG